MIIIIQLHDTEMEEEKRPSGIEIKKRSTVACAQAQKASPANARALGAEEEEAHKTVDVTKLNADPRDTHKWMQSRRT